MKKIRTITEDEMIAVFLKAEIKSDRWRDKVFSLLQREGKDVDILENPDISSKEQNEYRRNLLGDFRGYGRNSHLFQDFPTILRWERILLNKEELEKVLYIDWDYWVEVTDGTRSPKYLADKIREGKFPDGEEANRFKQVSESLKSGAKFPEVILVTEDENSKLVALEGHVRLTAYFLAPEFIPDELEVIIGFSKDINKWGLY